MSEQVGLSDVRERAIAELKKTSANYARLQEAIELRRLAILEGHVSGSDTYDRIAKLIKGWSARWKDEQDAVQIPASKALLNAISEAEGKLRASCKG